MGTGYKGYSFLKGSKYLYVGADADIFEYQTIGAAITAAQNGAVIFIEPGTYTIATTTQSCTKAISLIGLGMIGDVIVTSALATSTFTINEPATYAAGSFKMKFENISFQNSSTGSCVAIDNNGGAALDLYVDFLNCSFVSAAGTGIIQSHTTTTKNQFINIAGSSPALCSIAASTFAQKKAGDIVTVIGMACKGDFTLDTVAVASIFNIFWCLIGSASQTTGGDAAKILNYGGNFKGGTQFGAAIGNSAAGDFDATGTEYAGVYA